MSIFIIVMAAFAVSAEEPPAGSAAGRVTDQSGAVVQGVAVRLNSHEAGRGFATATGANGRFLLRGVPPGNYDAAAQSPGFSPYRGAVEIRSGETASLDIVLAVSPLAETVTVTAKAPPAEGAFESRPRNSREVLELREVRESGARDAGEALSELEGLWKIRKGGIANDVVLRGFQQGNIDVIIDGERIYGACPNHMDPSAFHADFAEVETVQVTKGPFDVRNQGSLGGTVELAARRPGTGFHAAPNLAAGSFGFWNPSLMISHTAGHFYGLGGFSYRRSDVYRDGGGRRVTDYANFSAGGARQPAFDAATGWVKAGGNFAGGQSFDIGYTRQQGGRTLYPYLQMDAGYDDADRARASWSLRRASGALQAVRTEAYFTQVKHWMTDELRLSSAGAPRGFTMATFAGTKATGGRLEAELPGTIVGIEAYRRNWNAVNIMRMSGMYMDQVPMPDVQALSAGIYGQHRQVFGRLQVTAGARLDRVSDEARSANLNTDLYWAYHDTRSTAARNILPSGYVSASYALPHGVEWFAGAGSSARTPDPEERYYSLRRSGTDWVGNPALNPSRNNEIDIGFNAATRRFSLRPTLFYGVVNDFIVLVPEPIQHPIKGIMGVMNTSARSYENVQARIRGGELSYSLAFSRALLLSGGVSYTRGTQHAYAQSRAVPGDLAEMPPLKSRASLRYGNRLFFGEVEAHAMSRQDRVDRVLREQPTAGFALLGARVGIHHKRINLTAGVDNLFDRFYYEHLSFQRDPFRTGVRVPEPGRSAYLNLSLALDQK